MEDICSIFRDILSMAPYSMNGLPSVLVFVDPVFIIKHHKVWLNLRVRMNPDIYKGVYFLSHIFPLLSLFFSFFPVNLGAFFTAKIIIVLNSL